METKDFSKVQRKHAGTSRNMREKLEETVLSAKNVLAHAASVKESLYELKRKEIEEYVSNLRHKGHHSLANDVDQSFRKISECLAEFEDSLSRYKTAFTTNQREKLEMDFKREMKRIQRQRDQIKQWLNDTSIKDKTMLEEMKLIIETQMERYKAIERECKAREYSAYSLNVYKPISALEQEEQNVICWLSSSVEALESQVDKLEIEIDEIVNAKKRKFDRQQQLAMDENKACITKHKFHIGKLETIKRILTNVAYDEGMLTSFLTKVAAIKDDVEYYIESGKDPEYNEVDGLYDEIDEVERGCFDGKLKASATVTENCTRTPPKPSAEEAKEELPTPIIPTPPPPIPTPPKPQSAKEKEPIIPVTIPPLMANLVEKKVVRELNKRVKDKSPPERRFVPIRMLPKQTLQEYVPQKYLMGPSSSSSSFTTQNSGPGQFSGATKSTTKFSNSNLTTEPTLRPVSPWTQRNYNIMPAPTMETKLPSTTPSASFTSESCSKPISAASSIQILPPPSPSPAKPNSIIASTEIGRLRPVEARSKTNVALNTGAIQSPSPKPSLASTKSSLSENGESSSSWIKVKSKRSRRPVSKVGSTNSTAPLQSIGRSDRTYGDYTYIVPRVRRNHNKSKKIVSSKTARAQKAARAGWAMKSMSRSELYSTVVSRTSCEASTSIPAALPGGTIGGWKISSKLQELYEGEQVEKSAPIPKEDRPLTYEEMMFQLAFPPLEQVYQNNKTWKMDEQYLQRARAERINGYLSEVSSFSADEAFAEVNGKRKSSRAKAAKTRVRPRTVQFQYGKRARYFMKLWPKAWKIPDCAQHVIQNLDTPFKTPQFAPLIEAFESAVLISSKNVKQEEIFCEYRGPPSPFPTDEGAFFDIPGLEGPPESLYKIVGNELVKRFGGIRGELWRQAYLDDEQEHLDVFCLTSVPKPGRPQVEPPNKLQAHISNGYKCLF